MELDDRLKKIASGVSVTDAIDAYMQELAEEGEIEDSEEAVQKEILAIVEVMFLMAAVDGEIAEDEIDQLRASLEALSDIQDADLDLEETLAELNDRLTD